MEKIALVSGSSRGIGRAVAAELARQGWAVCINYRVREDCARSLLEQLTAEGCRAMMVQADVSQRDQVEAMVRRVEDTFGPVSLLVNNAGVAGQALFQDITPELWHRYFSVNVDGAFHTIQAVLPAMLHAHEGCILNISSIWGQRGASCETAYSATKAAVNAYTMALANELRPFGVTVCAVMPGDIHTGFTAARRKVSAGDDIYQGRISRSVKRMEHDEETGMDPAKAGAYIASVAMREGHHHPLYAIRFDYKFFTFLAKVLPARFLNWLIYCLYGK